MQVANPNRAQFKKNSIFIPSDFPHFLKSTIGKELAPSKSALVTPSPILLILILIFHSGILSELKCMIDFFFHFK